MYNTSKNYWDEKKIFKNDSSLIDFLKNDEHNKTSNLKRTLPSFSLEYKKRKQNYKIKSSIFKLEQSDLSHNKSSFPDIKVEVNRIQNVRALNDEFTKKIYQKRKKRIQNEEGQQTSFDIRLNLLNKNMLSEKACRLNNNIHNQVLNFDNTSDDILKQQLIILRRYSVYTFEMIKNALDRKNRSGNVSPNTEKRQLSKSLDTFFQRHIHTNSIPTINITNSSDIKQEIRQALLPTENAILEAVDERRKKASNNVEKVYTLKEKEVNPYFDNVLEKVFRKVNYITEKNNPICEDYVLNLVHEEIVNITQNIENLIKSPAFIKNFTKKNDIDLIENNKILPFIKQSNSQKPDSGYLNKTFFNSSNKLSNQDGLNPKLSKKYSLNSNMLPTNLLSIKEENINEDNLQDYSEIQNRNLSSKGKRNLSTDGTAIIKKNSQIRLSLNLKEEDKNAIKEDLEKKDNKLTNLSIYILKTGNLKLKDIRSLNIEESYNTIKSNEDLLKLNDPNLHSKNDNKTSETVYKD
jgi:hypothetical protein